MKNEKPFELSEEQSIRVNAFFDGELSEREAEQLRNELAGQGVRLESLASELSFIGNSLRSFLHSEVGSMTTDMWEAIGTQIQTELSQKKSRTFFSWAKEFFAWRNVWTPRVALPSLGVATLAIVLAATTFKNVTSGDPSEVGREAAPEYLFVTDNQLLSRKEFPIAYAARNVDTRLTFRNDLDDVLRERARRQLLGEHIVHNGWQNETVNIDYIRSNRNVNIVPSKSKSEPPIIWVSRRPR